MLILLNLTFRFLRVEGGLDLEPIPGNIGREVGTGHQSVTEIAHRDSHF